MSEKVQLTLKDRQNIWWRSQFLQASWNYERMQNLGWAYTMVPAIKKLYTKKEDQQTALKRHMEFFNTHPYVAAPIVGVTLALEEERANGGQVDDTAIQGVKIGMMGPLAGIGDPVFWFTVRPILGALGASLAVSGNIIGPMLFFIVWNAIRMLFLWYTQEFGYKSGREITKDMSGGILQDITKGASILGMFIIAVLAERWVSIKFAFNVSEVQLDDKAFIHWDKLPEGSEGIREAFAQVGQGLSQTPTKITSFQQNLDGLLPGVMHLLLTFLCMWLLKKKVSPITIIVGLFIVGILARVAGIM
ncbi:MULTISPECIES: PTS system mannose/fructose/sorbose family transporter subunit IID [unclassified Streptococcus]|uniref:PTS system mannose/fructose/sorbose family transporter subunit IID n=1 Tax=unclassified Streptococcus TaxID=2608887 RepID=UPI00359EC27B